MATLLFSSIQLNELWMLFIFCLILYKGVNVKIKYFKILVLWLWKRKSTYYKSLVALYVAVYRVLSILSVKCCISNDNTRLMQYSSALFDFGRGEGYIDCFTWLPVTHSRENTIIFATYDMTHPFTWYKWFQNYVIGML